MKASFLFLQGRDSNRYYELMLDEADIESLKRLSGQIEQQIDASDLLHYQRYYALSVNNKYSSKRALGNNNLIPNNNH